ncbi:hypothetical protein BE20_21590 [Sorangium cellulosum]|nr:hypothetical protein BE20_21590 [Sorangium cellulosum]
MARFAPVAIGVKNPPRAFSKIAICIGSMAPSLISATSASSVASISVAVNSLAGVGARLMSAASSPSPVVSPDPHAAVISASPKAATQRRPILFMRPPLRSVVHPVMRGTLT